jgi:hypothetical protein
MALIILFKSAKKAEQTSKFSAKQHNNSTLLVLKIPPQKEAYDVKAPSVFHMIQLRIRGCQMISLIVEPLED